MDADGDRRYFEWESLTDPGNEEEPGRISDQPWACQAQHLAECNNFPQDTELPTFANRYERDVFCLARAFIHQEWMWYTMNT